MSERPPLRIGQLARAAGVNRETIRYYERTGLLDEPPRSASGYREFPPETPKRIRFIRRAQELGFTLSEVASLLALRVDDHSTCEAVTERARTKLAQVEDKISDLSAIRASLTQLIDACATQSRTGECPILEFLEDSVPPGP